MEREKNRKEVVGVLGTNGVGRTGVYGKNGQAREERRVF